MTQKQIDKIVSIICQQCNLIVERNSKNAVEFPELVDDDYQNMRGHAYTSAIYAGFQPGMDIEGLSVEKHKYGRGHCQPDIGNQEIIAQIYSSDASFDTDEIKAKKAGSRRYYIFKYYQGKNGRLTRVVLINTATESEQVVYSYKKSPASSEKIE